MRYQRRLSLWRLLILVDYFFTNILIRLIVKPFFECQAPMFLDVKENKNEQRI